MNARLILAISIAEIQLLVKILKVHLLVHVTKDTNLAKINLTVLPSMSAISWILTLVLSVLEMPQLVKIPTVLTARVHHTDLTQTLFFIYYHEELGKRGECGVVAHERYESHVSQ